VILDIKATYATGTAERESAVEMLDEVSTYLLPGNPAFLVTDTKYGSGDFLADVLDRGIIPHIPLLASPKREPIPTWKRKTNNPKIQAQRIQRVREAKARNAARFIAHTDSYRRSQALRKRVEHSFAEGKQQHGLRRARYRGLVPLQEQLYCIASVQNLKRLVSFMNRKKKAASACATAVSDCRSSSLKNLVHSCCSTLISFVVDSFIKLFRCYAKSGEFPFTFSSDHLPITPPLV
jgi:hypothetical protein